MAESRCARAAMVARTYAAPITARAGKPFILWTRAPAPQYAGRVPPTSPAWTAARDTAGQVLLWEGELFPAFYHTESGGYTEDPRSVFAARNLPGLKPVRCDFSAGAPHFYWSLDLKLTEVGETLRRNGVDSGVISAIDVTERTPSLRASVVTVRGDRGAVPVRGNDFRRMLGYDTFKSTLFAVVLDVSGSGSRTVRPAVGMYQWGAQGWTEKDTPRARSSIISILGHAGRSRAGRARTPNTGASSSLTREGRHLAAWTSGEFPEARAGYRSRSISCELGVKASAPDHRHYRRLPGWSRVVAVVNFPPKRIGPFVSEVLVLGAYDEGGEVILLAPDRPVGPGSRIG